jgi:diguanylate cyclase
MLNLQEPCTDKLNGSERFVHSRADVADAPPACGDIAIIDWCLAFDAVRARLRSSVGPTHLAPLSPRDPARQVRSQVLQCVEALDQLESTMANYIERTGGLDQALSNASAALAQAQAELGRARDGERVARHLASHDGLTSLPNGPGFRARLAEVVAQAADQGQTFAVLNIDLDGFKAVNDVHGHATGDELLRIVGARLRGAVRADDMVSRLGGDEFACLLWAAPPSRAALNRLATDLFAAVSTPFQVGPLSLDVHPSIGIAMWPADGGSAEALMQCADAAMYAAKRERCGHAFYDSSMGF